jgi:DNA (cytosine-5)-methyltransferase 1
VSYSCRLTYRSKAERSTSDRDSAYRSWAHGVQIYGNAGGREHWPNALGVDWMTAKEMTECVPPAYTEHIGRQLLDHIRSVAA